MRLRLSFALLLAVAAPSAANVAVPSLDDFAAPSDIRSVRLSPSGSMLMIIRRTKDESYEIELRDTARMGQGGFAFGVEPAEVREAGWLTDDLILVNARQRVKDGRASRWVDKLVIFDTKGKLRGGLPGVNPQSLSTVRREPGILYLSVDAGNGVSDVVRYDARSGRAEKILRGSDRRSGFIVDSGGEVRLSSIGDVDKLELRYFARRKGQSEWNQIHTLSLAKRETWQPLGFYTDNPDELVIIANEGDDKAALRIFDLAQNKVTRTLYKRDDVSIDDVVISRRGEIVGARYATDMQHIFWFDPARKALAETMADAAPGRSLEISDASASGARILRSSGPQDPASYYLTDAGGTIQSLGSAYPQFTGKTLAQSQFTSFKARDGLSIPVYLTKPAVGTAPFPLVVLPHGGPWARDYGGFDLWAQFLASRGYLVAQPQFRGSQGLGSALWKAGDREWGGKMQDDLDDTVLTLRKQGLADPVRTAMVGWSYGGYAALVASFRGNGLYRCSIAGAAVSNLDQTNALISTSLYTRIVQKPTIKGLSPVDHLGKATIPLLVIHGDEDKTVDVSQGRAANAALTAGGKPHRYVEIKALSHSADEFTTAQSRQLMTEFSGWLSKDCL
jgi:dipeptidyl aminopeptidase/acylaminoacyl peptidase